MLNEFVSVSLAVASSLTNWLAGWLAACCMSVQRRYDCQSLFTSLTSSASISEFFFLFSFYFHLFCLPSPFQWFILAIFILQIFSIFILWFLYYFSLIFFFCSVIDTILMQIRPPTHWSQPTSYSFIHPFKPKLSSASCSPTV